MFNTKMNLLIFSLFTLIFANASAQSGHHQHPSSEAPPKQEVPKNEYISQVGELPLVVQWKFTSGPFFQDGDTTKESRALIEFFEINGNTIGQRKPLVAPPIVKLSMKMGHHGDHDAAPVRLVSATDTAGNIIPGAYDITRIYFNMAGTWQAEIQVDGTNKANFNIEVK